MSGDWTGGTTARSAGQHYSLAVTPAEQNRRLARLDQPGRHLWTVLAVWHVAHPDRTPTVQDPALLDAENLIMVQGPGCFKCECAYSPELAAQPCPGSMELQ